MRRRGARSSTKIISSSLGTRRLLALRGKKGLRGGLERRRMIGEEGGMRESCLLLKKHIFGLLSSLLGTQQQLNSK